jgi:hypothetical protein
MSTNAKMVWDRIIGVQARKLPLLTAAEQTKLSWVKAINSFDEVPQVYRGFFENQVAEASTFPYAVLTPSYAGFLTRAKEKLVCCLDGNIYVLEVLTGDLTTTCYAIPDISYLEVGEVLLQSWVKIRGLTGTGVLTSSQFKFNTVTDYLFTPIVERIRPAAVLSEGIDPSLERSKFNHLAELSLKLTNYAKRSVMPGVEVLCFILQPEIRVEMLRLLGRSMRRTRCTPHLSILTDKELILIQDGAREGWSKSVRYGGVWLYIPLAKVTSISLAATEDDLFTMSIHLPGDDRIESLFSVPNRAELDEFLSRFEAIQVRRMG